MSSAVVGVANTSPTACQKPPPATSDDVGDDQRDDGRDDQRRPEQRREQRGEHPGAVRRDERGLEAERQQWAGAHRTRRLLGLRGDDQAERLEAGGDQVLDALGRQRAAVRRAHRVGDLLRGARRVGVDDDQVEELGELDHLVVDPPDQVGRVTQTRPLDRPQELQAHGSSPSRPGGSRWDGAVVVSCGLGGVHRSGVLWGSVLETAGAPEQHAHRLVGIRAAGPRRGTASPGRWPATGSWRR